MATASIAVITRLDWIWKQQIIYCVFIVIAALFGKRFQLFFSS